MPIFSIYACSALMVALQVTSPCIIKDKFHFSKEIWRLGRINLNSAHFYAIIPDSNK